MEKEVGRTEAIQYTSNAGWSSLVARWAHNPKVAGSNPAPATKPPYISFTYRDMPRLLVGEWLVLLVLFCVNLNR